ncbi:hypothetical protein [Actinomyces qiguomingii]|uniref:hypothetical protein n=1 Tax=Actinomyces qiguomingii TaxID=2057800 RepID=UPI000CA084DB|nr:hypothetical protein [Actinomyces qiguomingii]
MTQTIRSELRKLLANALGVAAVVAPVVAVPLLAGLLTRPTAGAVDAHNAVLRALQLTQMFPVIVGGSVSGQEYTESALRTSLLAVPRRAYLFWGKTVVVIVIVGISYLASLGIALLMLGPDLASGTALAAGASWLGLAILAEFLAMACRSLVVPLATLVPLILGLSMIIHSFTPLARFLPDLATITVFLGPGPQLLAPAPGGLVLLAWAIASGIAAFTVLVRSDVR